MLRITKTSEDDQTVALRLDGKIVSTTLSGLEELCLRYRDEEKKTVVLDFSGVTFIDSGGLEMLKKAKNRGIEMVNGSLFIQTLLSGLRQ